MFELSSNHVSCLSSLTDTRAQTQLTLICSLFTPIKVIFHPQCSSFNHDDDGFRFIGLTVVLSATLPPTLGVCNDAVKNAAKDDRVVSSRPCIVTDASSAIVMDFPPAANANSSSTAPTT
eukprot:TRINITY_DN8548_c0_g1_i1.p1 TRINITY_DN8548_c0_g1~~TRINITY_DN8548_c0_g1_i1.p1  ORF type:complete len:120 (+),score=8.89 TRINITY_DN8548_c0_g1_i1:479-838(+)